MLSLDAWKISHIILILAFKTQKLKCTDGTGKRVNSNLSMKHKSKEFLWFWNLGKISFWLASEIV